MLTKQKLTRSTVLLSPDLTRTRNTNFAVLMGLKPKKRIVTYFAYTATTYLWGFFCMPLTLLSP